MICVSLGHSRHKGMIAEHAALAQRGVELVELRIDWIARSIRLNDLIKNRPTPIILTCRRPADGGQYHGTEEQRLTLLREGIVAGVEYVDLEEDAAKTIRRYGKTKRIVSYHNFDETPDDLEEIHARLCKLDADVVKIVTMAQSPADNVRLLNLIKNSPVPTVAFCMGEYGIVSRILCGRYGAPFTYCTPTRERSMAPGQLPYEEMKKLYRYDSITEETALFGVLGDPIAQSWSPLLHNAAFRRAKLNAVYLPIRVQAEHFEETLKAFDTLGFRGYSVTIPHKEIALRLAQRADDAAKSIGAANTLFKDRSGNWCAANTDMPAAMACIQIGLDQKSDPQISGKRVLILGAGGAARAIATGCSKASASLMVTNRSKDRGMRLAEELKCQFVTWANRGSQTVDVIVNCTPTGMFPDMNETPYEQYWFRDGVVVFDTIYNPENTLFIKEAKEHRCVTVSGVEMFVRQAAAQFHYFTGREVPLEEMRTTLRRGISPVRIRTETGHAAPTETAPQPPETK